MSTVSGPLWFVDSLAYVRLDGAETGGAYGLVELSGRRGEMPPLHVHHHDDEAFHVLEGELTLFAGDREITVAAGGTALAPRGLPHAYRIESESARYLVIASPAGFEGFVRAASDRAPADELPPPGRPLDPAALARVAAEHGIEILGPPGMLPADLR